MKNQFVPLAMTVMIVLSSLASCSSKKMQASTPSTKIKKDTSVASEKKTEADAKKTTVVLPIDVKDNFANTYPLAQNVSWVKSSDANTEKNTAYYNVAFTNDNKVNRIVYSEKGVVVEERQQITIDQLPQNIYNSIKEKYPTYSIASAETYKHFHKDGSYVAHLRPLSTSDANEIEVIFRENGSQVE